MRRVIVGFGNDLRGEDGFGIEVVKQLQKYPLKNTKLIRTFQLTPELALELQEFDEIIFVDAAHSDTNHYALACNLEKTNQNTISHHISIEMILSILNSLYDSFPTFQVYSMLTNSYDIVKNQEKYNENIIKTVKYIKNL
ncbi:MAG: hydrogenase maturation protease [Arcobacteraceae bacterium]|nr:hydrogenase maturation protease [Arcobacteraceae bacterium]